jgi:hypothetical protein
MGTFSGVIGQADLSAIIEKKVKEFVGASDTSPILAFGKQFKNIFPEVVADLSVKFGWDNLSVMPQSPEDWSGYHLVSGGLLPVLVVRSGDDHEVPVYFIVYWNGKRLCGYVPDSGNLFCRDTFVAYGNEKTPLSEKVMSSLEYDFGKMQIDIESNIKFESDKPVAKAPEKKMKVEKVRPSAAKLSDAIDLLIHGISARESCNKQVALQDFLVDVRFAAFRLGLNFEDAVAESGKNE